MSVAMLDQLEEQDLEVDEPGDHLDDDPLAGLDAAAAECTCSCGPASHDLSGCRQCGCRALCLDLPDVDPEDTATLDAKVDRVLTILLEACRRRKRVERAEAEPIKKPRLVGRKSRRRAAPPEAVAEAS